MNFKERINAVFHHEKPDKVPWVPYDNLVPRGDFERYLRNQGMGLCARRSSIWSEMPGVESVTKGGAAITTYKTPAGNVSTEYRTHLGRISDGADVQTKWMIQDVSDYEPVIYMIENTVFHADYSVYHNSMRDLGDDGIVRGHAFTPPYDMTEEYFGLQNWAFHQQDHPEEFSRLLEALEKQVERRLPLVIESPEGFVDCGSINGWYGPKQFKKYIIPFYKKYIPLLHKKGKICSIHAHASNLKVFKDLVPELGADVVEAFTPPPIGDLSLKEARAAWGSDVIIWINFPETIFFHGEEETRKYTIELLKSDSPGDALVFGMTEMGSYGIQDSRTEQIFKTGMKAVTEVINEYGKYPILRNTLKRRAIFGNEK